MKVKSEESLCIAAGRCVAVAAEIFELDDDGFVISRTVDVPEDQRPVVEQAVVLCPSKALEIVAS